MAPALTSEAATRAREEIQGSPPAVSHPLVNLNPREEVQRERSSTIDQDQGVKKPISQLSSLATDIIKRSLLDPDLGCQLTNLSKVYSSEDIEDLYLKQQLLINSPVMATQKDNSLSSVTSGKNGLSVNVDKKDSSSTHNVTGADNSNSSLMIETSHETANGVNKIPQLLKPDLHTDNSPSASSSVSELPLEMTPPDVVESQPGPSTRPSSVPVQVLYNETSLSDINTRQVRLSNRVHLLLRRLRRLQCKQTISHVKQQISGLVELLQKTLPHYKRTDSRNEFMLNRDVKNLSTATLVNLIHSWQSKEAQAQQRDEKHPRTKLKEELCLEMDRVATQLNSNMRHLETSIDSDATESSSGGESCEEEMDYDCEWDRRSKPAPVKRRIEYKWAKERALIASKWTWLQAQVSDLEYRIRQQNDIFNQIKESKGVVTLVDPPSLEDTIQRIQNQGGVVDEKLLQASGAIKPSPSDISKLLHNVDKQSATISKQLGNVYSPALNSNQTMSPNGLLDTKSQHFKTPDNSINSSEHPSPEIDLTCQAARCRAVKSYRKRKLLRTKGLHQISRKAARLSTVKCHCYPPLSSCAICSGRFNNIMAVDSDTMSFHERVAIIDPAFHPVLSFNEDIPLSSRFEGLLKSAEWLEQHSANFTKKKSKDKNKKKLSKKLSASASAAMLSRIKNKYDSKLSLSHGSGALPSSPKRSVSDSRVRRTDLNLKKKRAALQTIGDSLRKKNQLTRYSSTRLASSNLSKQTKRNMLTDLKEALRKKRGENAYDIDNIVIPHSIAAATRVEKPKYKEITTPSWREVDTDGQTKKPKEEQLEDLTDEVYAWRHIQCEVDEKKRYNSFMTSQKRGRGMRTDSMSQADPDGANTPLPTPPMTPHTPANISKLNYTNDSLDFKRSTSSVSMKHELDASHRRRSSSVSSNRSRTMSYSDDRSLKHTPDNEDRTPPWPIRAFPLAGEDFEDLSRDRPSVLSVLTARTSNTHRLADYNLGVMEVDSPLGLSSDSENSVGGDDADDPEWTVIKRERTRKNSGLVLKLAKR